ncbi:MAG: RDD family protein [Flavobacteriales bacterium]|nr:RDD family protein [Flavobacteriales bacterium]
MKITELKITKYKTVEKRDGEGNLVRSKVPYEASRPIALMTGGKRFAHFFADGFILRSVFWAMGSILGAALTLEEMLELSSNLGTITSIASISFISYPVYYIISEHIWQRTPGKFLTKCRVINAYGEKPDLPTNILRNLIRLVPFEILSCLSDRGWHDRWSDTYVVPDEEYDKLKKLLDEQKE